MATLHRLALPFGTLYIGVGVRNGAKGMIVTCPSCSARFRLDAVALAAGGRRVKCGRCAHIWLQRPPADGRAEAPGAAPAPPDSAAPDLDAAVAEPPEPAARIAEHVDAAADADWAPPPLPARRRRPEPTLPRRPKPAKRRAAPAVLAVALVLVLGGIGVAGYLARDAILRALPDTEKLLAMVRPPPPVAGLEIGKLESERRRDDGVPVLVIRGEIANPSVGAQHLPPLMASLYDAEGKELRSWRFTAAETTVPAEQQVRFQTELRDPPDAATDLKISFVAE